MKPISENLRVACALAVSAWVAGVSGYLCYLNPGHRWPYLMVFALMGGGWAVRQLVRVNRHEVTSGLILAGALLGVALLAKLDGLPMLDGSWPERATGVMTGALVMMFANVIPKQISHAARAQSARRAAGWAMLLGGLGYSMAWLCLPLAYANDAALAILLAGVAYAAWRIIRCRSLAQVNDTDR